MNERKKKGKKKIYYYNMYFGVFTETINTVHRRLLVTIKVSKQAMRCYEIACTSRDYKDWADLASMEIYDRIPKVYIIRYGDTLQHNPSEYIR